MNISSIGGGASALQQLGRAAGTDVRSRIDQGMSEVAKLFGTTGSQLMSDVKASGQSLADYATSKGVSKDDLINAIKQGLQANAPNGAQLSDTQLTNMADRIANHKPGSGPDGPPPGDAVSGVGLTTSTASGTNSVNALLDMLSRIDARL